MEKRDHQNDNVYHDETVTDCHCPKQLVKAKSLINNLEKCIHRFCDAVKASEYSSEYEKDISYIKQASVWLDLPKILNLIQMIENNTGIKFKPT